MTETTQPQSDFRVTEDYIKSRIVGVQSQRWHESTLTICVITLDNGFTVTGESACCDPANYNQELGEKYAYENAFEKLWAFLGFSLIESKYQQVKKDKAILEDLKENGAL